MPASRDDLGIEGNTARRLFWEICASRQPTPRSTYRRETGYETPEDIAQWADWMLEEWDKRWIAEEIEGKTDTHESVRPCPKCGGPLYKINCNRSGEEGLVCINGHGY